MKKLVLIATILMATAAQAQQVVQAPEWQQKLEQYKADAEQMTLTGLKVRQAYYVGMALGTCSASIAIGAATFVADTFPLTNFLGEGVANMADPDYETYETLMSWETLANLGRGTAGAGVVGVAETLEFVVLWLGGNEAQSYESLKKAYASTVATTEALFAQQGQCMMSVSKLLLTRAEMSKRLEVPSPMQPSSDIVHP